MRVLHLFDWYLPSTLSWVGYLLRHLEPAEIWVAAPWIVKNQFYHTQLRYFRAPWQLPGLLRPKSETQLAVWRDLFVRSQRFLPLYVHWLEHQLRNDPPDILHAHFGPTGCRYLPLAQRLNRPLVVTFYGFDYQKVLHYRPAFREKYHRLFASAARVLAASETGCAALEALGCPAEKLAVVRPSLDLAVFPFIKKTKPKGQLNLVQAATITGKKGHLTTLEAFRLALRECPNLRLTLAGEKQDRVLVQQLEQFIGQHNLAGKIDWRGPVEHREMPNFLAQFDAFIHPSCYTPDGDHEATPVVLLEAQATGLPILATRHFDLADAVSHGRTGLLVAENDVEGLAAAIADFYFMENENYTTFRARARAWIEAGFLVRMSADALLKIYAGLV